MFHADLETSREKAESPLWRRVLDLDVRRYPLSWMCQEHHGMQSLIADRKQKFVHPA